MKRVLQIAHGFNPPFLDVANHYARLFGELDAEVDTLYLSGQRADHVEQATLANRVMFWELTSRNLRGLKLRYIARLVKLIKSEGYDLVVCHRYKAIFIASLARLFLPRFEIVGVMHNFGYFRRLPQKLFLSLFKDHLHLLAVSNALRDDIRAAASNFPRERVQTLYNAIDYAGVRAVQLDRAEARRALGLDPNDFLFLNAGRLHPDKDQATLIRAFALSRQRGTQAKLAIMGSGRLEKEMKTLCKELGVGDEVIFLGQVKNGAQYFKAFDAFVLTSAREPFGLVLLEAMAAGLPIASVDTGGAPEVVGDAGYICKGGDSEELSRILCEMRQLTQKDRGELAEKMDAHVNAHFTLDACRHQFLNCGLVLSP